MLGQLVALKGWALVGAESTLFFLAAMTAYGIFHLIEWLASAHKIPQSDPPMTVLGGRTTDGSAQEAPGASSAEPNTSLPARPTPLTGAGDVSTSGDHINRSHPT